MPLEYGAAPPPSGPVRRPDFRAGALSQAFGGDYLEEVEPARGKAAGRPAQSGVYASRAAKGEVGAAEYTGAIGSAMAGLGLNRKARVGVYGPNCPEWML